MSYEGYKTGVDEYKTISSIKFWTFIFVEKRCMFKFLTPYRLTYINVKKKSRKPGFRNTDPEREKVKQNPAKMLEVFDFFLNLK